MPLTRLLFLCVILAVPVGLIAQTSHPVESGPLIAIVENMPSADGGATTQSFQITPASPRDDAAVLPYGDICYKIRAYIFKRDDDHAPEMVRSTTCGPRIPHQKNVTGPKAKLVPAN
ncbi:MAG: hypothetical protein WCC25_02845 [Candidatus Korobacteraceae bacterium]